MDNQNLPIFIKEVETKIAALNDITQDIDTLKDQIKALQEKKKIEEMKYNELKETLLAILETFGVKRYRLGSYDLTIKNKPFSVEIENEHEISDEYIVKKVKYEIDKQKIRAFYKEMQVVPAGVKIANGKTLTIKKSED